MTLNNQQLEAVNAVSAAFEADNDRLASMAAEKQLLQTEYDQYKETHPDAPPAPVQTTLFGSSVNGPLFAELAYSKADVTRVYLRSLPKGSTWFNIVGDAKATNDLKKAVGLTNKVLWISWKETDPALVDAFLATMPKTLPFEVWGTMHHEPEDDGPPTGTYTAAKFVADQKVHSPIARKYGLKFATILMRYTFGAGSGRNWKDYFPDDLKSYVDIFGCDSYNLGNKKSTYSDVTVQLQPIADAAASVGKPWAIGETGASVFNNQPAVRAQWANLLAEEAKKQGCLAIAWWDQDSYVFDALTANVWMR